MYPPKVQDGINIISAEYIINQPSILWRWQWCAPKRRQSILLSAAAKLCHEFPSLNALGISPTKRNIIQGRSQRYCNHENYQKSQGPDSWFVHPVSFESVDVDLRYVGWIQPSGIVLRELPWTHETLHAIRQFLRVPRGGSRAAVLQSRFVEEEVFVIHLPR